MAVLQSIALEKDGEKTVLQAATILVAMASEKNSGESHQLVTNRLKEKRI